MLPFINISFSVAMETVCYNINDLAPMFIFIFADNRVAIIIIFMLTSVYSNYLLYNGISYIMGRVCITVNLLIDQNCILYLLLHEIICLDDENFLEMRFGDVAYLLALSLSIGNGVTCQ